MRPVLVVVPFEHAQDAGRLSLVDDQDAVEKLASNGADEAFGNRVRPGPRTGDLMIVIPDVKYRVSWRLGPQTRLGPRLVAGRWRSSLPTVE
jgi:hypothetical protein